MRLLFLAFSATLCYNSNKSGKGGDSMAYILAVIGGYLLGCPNMALYLAKKKNVDLRAGGSGNLGASNATTLMGWGYGITVTLHDIGKALLAVLLAKLLFPGLEYAGAAAASFLLSVS